MTRAHKLYAGVATLALACTTALAAPGTCAADPPAAPGIPIDVAQAPGLPAMQQLSPVLQQAAGNPQNAASMLMAAAQAFANNSSAPADSRQVASSVNQFVQKPATPGQPESLVPSAQLTMPGALPGVPIPLPHNLNLPGDLNALLPKGFQLPSPDAKVPGAKPAAPPPDMDPNAHIPAPGAGPGLDPHLPPGVSPAFVVGPAPGEAPAPAPGAAPDSTPLAAPAAPGPAPAAAPAPAPAPAARAPEAVAPAPAPAAAPVTPAALPAPPPATGPAPGPAPAPDAAAPAPDAAAPPAPAPDAPAPDAPAPDPASAANPSFGPDAPPTQDFMYPSIGNGCLADGGNVLATAISVAGPASIPKPGPKAGQTAYVFTAIGTSAPAAEQKLPLNVTWVNLTTGQSGSATLKPNPEINPNGPTTLVAIADTGSGSIMSTIFGQVTTVDKQCTFMPTIGSTVVP